MWCKSHNKSDCFNHKFSENNFFSEIKMVVWTVK